LSELDDANSHPPRPTVFISYASEDREAARILKDAIPAFGLEVWHDESELGGGEAWDQKIRRQIRDCDYFMPLVSAQTEARHEGYFRREWRLAVERTLDMADDHLFLLPIVIDDTDQAVARVPEKFLAVQWLKVPGGRPTRALETLCRRVASADTKVSAPPEPRRRQPKPAALPVRSAEFPRAEPGQRMRFWAEVFVWACRSVWAVFKRLPRWLRIIVYLWLAIVLISRCDSLRHNDAADISPAKVEKLKAISEKYPSTLNKNDLIKLGTEIAKNVSDDSDKDEDGSALLAIPFTAPAGDTAAQNLAESAFATAYGKVSLSHHGQVSVTTEPLVSRDLGAALERGRVSHSVYVLWGTVDTVGKAQALTVKIAKVADGSVIWSKTYPAAGADPAQIASEVEAGIPVLAPP
jgi:hypothetical protein